MYEAAMFLQEDIDIVQEMIQEYGPQGMIKMLVLALEDYSDQMSDLGLKEKAGEATSMLELLDTHVEE
jgi:hypothetical protein